MFSYRFAPMTVIQPHRILEFDLNIKALCL